jgi:predicted PurR-regulated permease PerM/GAF domain-containing protein
LPEPHVALERDRRALATAAPVVGPRLSASSRVAGPSALTWAVIVAALYIGRDVFIPLTIAILLAFALEPAVARLRRWRFNRALAVILVVTFAMGAFAAMGLFVGGQVKEFAKDLPTYQANISKKLVGFRQSMREPGLLDQFTRVFGSVQNQLETLDKPDAAVGTARLPSAPSQVQVVPAPPSALQRLGALVDSAVGPLTTFGLVVLLTILILLNRTDLRDRLLRLLGGNLHRSTDVLGEAAQRVSRFLLMQLAVNALYAVPLAIGLALIGIPGAVMWGLLAAVLRFVPYLGPIIASVFPIGLAFAVDPGWSALFWTLGLIATLELVSNNIIEPWLYGSTTGLSAISLIVAAMFWTLLWGPIGLAVSTPLTVCLLVMGKYVPGLGFLDIMLGAEPALDEPTRLFQRLLAGNEDDAAELAVQGAKASSAPQFYQATGLPALRLASQAHRDLSTAEHRLRISDGLSHVLEEMALNFPAETTGDAEVVCIGARWELDAQAARMLVHAVELAGRSAVLVERDADNAPANGGASSPVRTARVVVLSSFAPAPYVYVRHMARRLRRISPDVVIVAALWNAPGEGEAVTDAPNPEALGCDSIAFEFEQAMHQVLAALEWHADASSHEAPVPDDDAQRVQALRESGLLEPAVRSLMDAAAKRAADVFDTPIGMVNLIDETSQLTVGHNRDRERPAEGSPATDVPRKQSMCGHVVAQAKPLAVNDVLRDPRFAANPMLRERGIRFYAGCPLVTKSGYALGTLCILDTVPHAFKARDLLLLESMAKDLMAEVDAVLSVAASRPQREAA